VYEYFSEHDGYEFLPYKHVDIYRLEKELNLILVIGTLVGIAVSGVKFSTR
jgi:hypothetical protein